ncbi:hypothetical protein RR46_14539 [Papilio xuthus]|uniref:Uncharacterized protein n=1 Tax=Papilio xuthus TaxID=66420 RepID=A0A194PIX0_PAPXU|nr:hypothetical protein RR46_14539 [Papilio xuthus]
MPRYKCISCWSRALGVRVPVKHVTVLLAESERECARMAQLSELLKGELRRVRGASAHAHNTEYMKNVTFKGAYIFGTWRCHTRWFEWGAVRKQPLDHRAEDGRLHGLRGD